MQRGNDRERIRSVEGCAGHECRSKENRRSQERLWEGCGASRFGTSPAVYKNTAVPHALTFLSFLLSFDPAHGAICE